jgi:hypothetical protein
METTPDGRASKPNSSRLVRWGRCAAFAIAMACLIVGSINGFFAGLEYVRADSLEASARKTLIESHVPRVQQTARLDLAAATTNAQYSLGQLKFVVLPLAGGAGLFFVLGCILHGLKLLLKRDRCSPSSSSSTDR